MKKKYKIIIGVLIGILLLIIGVLCTYIFLNNDNSNKTSKIKTIINENITGKNEFNMNFQEQYDDILDRYLNYQSIPINNYNGLKVNTKLYKEALISFKFYVKKVLEEHDDKYKIEVVLIDEYINSEDQILVIEGEYKNGNRLSEEYGVMYKAYGIYKKMENYTIDGISYVLPKIEIDKIVKQSEFGIPAIYTQTEIRNISKSFFNNSSVTVAEGGPTGEDIENGNWYPYYITTLNTSGNNMFSKFKFYADDGLIAVRPENDEGNVNRFISKASDGKGYIMTTYTSNYLEVQLYDENFKQIWSREFEKVERYTWDNNNYRIALVINNDLYYINEKNGKNIVDPFIVGQGLGVKVLANGDTIYITAQTKDFIMYINSKGKVVWRNDSKEIPAYVESILVGNDNIYVSYDLGYEDGTDSSYISVYTKNGDKVAETLR